MQEISWTKFKQKKLSEIKQGACLKITGDGQMAFYVVPNPQQQMRLRIEGLCSQIDAGK